MFKRILVPVDGSATSTKALITALQMAREAGGCVRLLHSVDEFQALSGFEYSADVMKIVRENAGRVLVDAMAIAKASSVQVDQQLVDEPDTRLGHTVSEAARIWEADLVVVGTHGRRGIGRVLMGSGAEQITREASVPVLVIRSDEPEPKA